MKLETTISMVQVHQAWTHFIAQWFMYDTIVFPNLFQRNWTLVGQKIFLKRELVQRFPTFWILRSTCLNFFIWSWSFFWGFYLNSIFLLDHLYPTSELPASIMMWGSDPAVWPVPGNRLLSRAQVGNQQTSLSKNIRQCVFEFRYFSL